MLSSGSAAQINVVMKMRASIGWFFAASFCPRAYTRQYYCSINDLSR